MNGQRALSPERSLRRCTRPRVARYPSRSPRGSVMLTRLGQWPVEGCSGRSNRVIGSPAAASSRRVDPDRPVGRSGAPSHDARPRATAHTTKEEETQNDSHGLTT